jgi:hypothetical protein
MTTPGKILTAATILGFLLFLGTCAYFVGGVSATSAPIRIYNCNESPESFITAIHRLTNSEKDITCSVTDVVGSSETGYATYLTVNLTQRSRVIEYSLKCEKDESVTDIELIMAYDKTHILGGYIAKADGVTDLVKVFEDDFLLRLKNKQKLTLKQNTSFWKNFSLY